MQQTENIADIRQELNITTPISLALKYVWKTGFIKDMGSERDWLKPSITMLMSYSAVYSAYSNQKPLGISRKV